MNLTHRWLIVGVAAASLAFSGVAAKPKVKIVEPKNRAVLQGPNVKVVLKASGIEIAPAAQEKAGTAHHHLFLDRDPTPATEPIPQGVAGIIHLGRGQTEFLFEGLTPGEHRVVAIMADPWHVPVPGAGSATVKFTVR